MDGILRFRPLGSLQQAGSSSSNSRHSSYFGGNDNSSSESEEGGSVNYDDEDEEEDYGQEVASEDDADFVPFGTKKQKPKAATPSLPVIHATQYPGIMNKFLQDSGSDDEIDVDSASQEEEVVLSVEAGASNGHRLQKLLAKTDRIVSNINASMTKFMESAALAEAEAVKAAAAEDGLLFDDEDLQHAADGSEVSIKGVYSPSASSSISSILSKDCHLRDYQQGGVEWLFLLHSQGLNGILADEMGLGKTLQVLAFLCSLWERHSIWGPHLVVMPMSVLTSWKGDLQRFCNAKVVNLHTHYGPKKDRLEALEQWRRALYTSKAKAGGGKAKLPTPWKVSIVLTTYDLSIKDQAHFQKIGKGPCRWSYLVVDEAHRLKNRSSVLFDALKRTNASRRLLLTGTPLQNNLGELWSLLSFILPEIFNNLQQFEDWFNRPFEFDEDDDGDDDIGSSEIMASGRASGIKKGSTTPMLSAEERDLIVTSLHRIIKPFLLRRMKVDVVQDMPPKIERTVYCPLSGLQRKVYAIIRSYVEKKEQASTGPTRGHADADTENEDKAGRTDGALFQAIFGGSPSGLSFNNVLMQLRKLCNHPFLVLEDMKTIPDDIYNKYLVSSSGKMCMLERLLQNLIPRGHKILIFSQMTTTLDIIHGFIQQSFGLHCCRLDGTTSREAREAQLLAFNDASHDGFLPIFLLSTRAGGVGINLQSADTVIFFDSDWNPQQDLQAMSRAHRLGQQKTVLVLRLVSIGADDDTPSVEERILRRAAQKLAAERVIISDGEFDMGTRHASSSRYPSAAVLSTKATCVMSLFSRELDVDADTVSLNTETSETSGVTSHSFNSDAGPDETVDTFSATKHKFPWRKDDFAKLDDAAILDICRRPPAANALKDDSFAREIPRDISAALTERICTMPMDDLSLDMQTILDWRPWLGVPPGMETVLQSVKKRSQQETGAFRDAADASPRGNLLKKAKSETGVQISSLPEEDICVLCQKPWVSAKEFSDLLGNHRASSNTGTKRKSIACLDDAKREVTMLICESCCGSYHMVCVGLYEVPENEWYCEFCHSLYLKGPPPRLDL